MLFYDCRVHQGGRCALSGRPPSSSPIEKGGDRSSSMNVTRSLWLGGARPRPSKSWGSYLPMQSRACGGLRWVAVLFNCNWPAGP
eukprot:4213002-Pyramimonas_sp.AAC.1